MPCLVPGRKAEVSPDRTDQRSNEGSRLLRFWVKAPNTNSEIGTTRLARADCASRAFAAPLGGNHQPRRARGRRVERVKVPNASSEIGTTLSRTRACGSPALL